MVFPCLHRPSHPARSSPERDPQLVLRRMIRLDDTKDIDGGIEQNDLLIGSPDLFQTNLVAINEFSRQIVQVPLTGVLAIDLQIHLARLVAISGITWQT